MLKVSFDSNPFFHRKLIAVKENSININHTWAKESETGMIKNLRFKDNHD
jgi:hypothetical protein